MKLKPYMLIVMVFTSIQCWALSDTRHFSKGDTIYIHAKNGLLVRKEADRKSKTVYKIPLGQKAGVISVIKNKVMAEGISGFWIKVSSGKHQGYVFSGFVSRFPVPQKGNINNTTFKKYSGTLTALGFKGVKYGLRQVKPPENHESEEESLEISNATLLDGYLLGRTLFQMPDSLKLPAVINKREMDISDPKKPAHFWARELKIKTDKDNKIINIVFSERQEGSGIHNEIKLNKNGALLITSNPFAD